jgi:hypothetical protein
VSDLYPRQQAGLWTVLTCLGIGMVFIGFGYRPHATAAELMLVLFLGLGLGMLSGNTRTLRVPGNRRRR